MWPFTTPRGQWTFFFGPSWLLALGNQVTGCLFQSAKHVHPLRETQHSYLDIPWDTSILNGFIYVYIQLHIYIYAIIYNIYIYTIIYIVMCAVIYVHIHVFTLIPIKIGIRVLLWDRHFPWQPSWLPPMVLPHKVVLSGCALNECWLLWLAVRVKMSQGHFDSWWITPSGPKGRELGEVGGRLIWRFPKSRGYPQIIHS